MLPRRLAATLGALRAAGMPATPSFLRTLTSAASASASAASAASAGAPPPPSAASAAPAPRPKNLRLDKSTLRLVERLRAVEEAKKSYADLQAPGKTLPVLAFASAQPTGALAALPDAVFATPLRADIVHRVIVWQEKNARSTLYKGKGRSEVRGGGRKPWKQKGTGRARVGSIRSPLWVGGGVAHPPKLKGWGTLLQKKVRRLGMRCVLAAKYRDRRLVVVDALRLGEGKTRSAAAALAAHGCAPGRRVLLVDVGPLDALLVRGLANIPGAQALPVLGANVRDIVLADRLFITTAGLEALVARVTKTD